MFEPGQGPTFSRDPEHSGWFTGISMAVAIVICIAAFIWIFLRIDPYLSDFIAGNEPTATFVAPPPDTPELDASPAVP